MKQRTRQVTAMSVNTICLTKVISYKDEVKSKLIRANNRIFIPTPISFISQLDRSESHIRFLETGLYAIPHTLILL